MDRRLVYLALLILAIFDTSVIADFFYNPTPPKPEDLEDRGLKCIPGRTVIKITEKQNKPENETEEEVEFRRSHMNSDARDETCEICVCSLEGKDEYCSKRPARNVNECIRMASLKADMENHVPYSHDRALAYRIRRDYIWHRDEIPYAAKSKCLRGTSYYSNSLNANDTDIDVASEIESLLDYDNIDVCFFCICSVDAKAVNCIGRDPWYCEYYRILKEPNAMRNKYARLFKQDRPAYFRQLSYRMRRTMDDTMYSLIDQVGDKEDDSKCVPFVSEYSDCTDANMCTGCTRCKCTKEGQWSCQDIVSCPDEGEEIDGPEESSIYYAVDVLFSDVQKRDLEKEKNQRYVPLPPKSEEDILLDNARYEEDFETYLSRQKRSLHENTGATRTQNSTIKFHNTVDEINEDTLKNTNHSGTIEAHKINPNLKISRRRGGGERDGINKTELSSLHIEYNQPPDYERQFAENKIDVFPHDEHTIALTQKIQGFATNYSQNTKDKNLSKIVVNELSIGKEIIGDKDVTPLSNITFTPENDTLTAMAFIAGNLLNKLWNMEKETSDSLETDTLKHEKINDLIELFKEPLNLRQETFLKNALEKLSNTLNDNKNINNVSICETFNESDVKENTPNHEVRPSPAKCNKTTDLANDSKPPKNKSLDVVHKLTDVLNLIKQFENTQSALTNLKTRMHTVANESVETIASEKNKFNLFASILEKITKLLLPSKNSHRIHRKMYKLNQLADDETFQRRVEANDNIDLGNMSITTKDKIILDYVNHIQSNPNCLLNKISQQSRSSTDIKGEIISHLKEFLKIQSLMDLSKLLQPRSKITTASPASPTPQPTARTTLIYDIIRKSDYKKTPVPEPKLKTTAKEKLKTHLQSIINDLAEMQQEHGSSDKKLNITDLLPCLSNILKDNIEPKSSKLRAETRSPIENIQNLIEALKLEFTSPFPTRRTGSGEPSRPTSAKVWKRVITNVNDLRKRNMRRFDANKPKSYEDLKTMIQSIEKLSNSYKKVASLSAIAPHKKLMLLKTLDADVAKHKNILNTIKNSYNTVSEVSLDNRKELIEFIDNTATNIKLSNNVILNLNKSVPKSSVKLSKASVRLDSAAKRGQLKNEGSEANTVTIKNANKDFKLTRDQIVNQLILNRIKLYLKLKEEEGISVDDVNYNIGKRALLNIQNGNDGLGRELFNVLVQNKKLEGLNQTRRMMTNKFTRKERRSSLLYSLQQPLLNLRGPAAGAPATSQDLIFVK